MSVLCDKCGEMQEMDFVFSCFNNGKKTYECINPCESKIVKIKEDKNKSIKEMCQGKTQEESFYDIYKLEFGDLIESDAKFRDGSTHYVHPETGMKIYSWNRFGKYWYESESLQNILVKDRCFDNSSDDDSSEIEYESDEKSEETFNDIYKKNSFKEKYELEFNDLIKAQQKSECIHYIHPQTDKKVYSWNIIGNYWYEDKYISGVLFGGWCR